MTKSTLFRSVLGALVAFVLLGACQKPADLDKLKHEWDAEVKVLADEARHLARWQLLLDKKRTELGMRGPSRLLDQAQAPLTQSGEELRELLTDIEKRIGPEAEAKRKAGKANDLIKYTDDTGEHMTDKLRAIRYRLEAADNLLAAAEHAPTRVAMGTPTPPTTPAPANPATPTPDATPTATGTTGGTPAAPVGSPPDRGSGAPNNPAAPTDAPAGH